MTDFREWKKVDAEGKVIPPRPVSSGDLGAVYELEAASFLMRKGFKIFRNLSPNGYADLVGLKNGELFTIQVKNHGKDLSCDLSIEYNDGNSKAHINSERIRPLFDDAEGAA